MRNLWIQVNREGQLERVHSIISGCLWSQQAKARQGHTESFHVKKAIYKLFPKDLKGSREKFGIFPFPLLLKTKSTVSRFLGKRAD
jgi:hypothetical protein